MELELLSDDVLDDMWNNPPTTMLNEFIHTIVILRQIALAQAELTAKQILSQLKGIDNEAGDSRTFDKNMTVFRNELEVKLYKEGENEVTI